MKLRICRNCEFYFTALFGDSYCTNEQSPHNDIILEFYGTNPPMKHRVWRCKYFAFKESADR